MMHSLFSNTSPDPVGDPITGITGTACVCTAVPWTAPAAELSAVAGGRLVGVPPLAPDLVL